MPIKKFKRRPFRKGHPENAVKKKYYIYNSGSEGCSEGIIFLTEAEAELVNRVSNKENWDAIIDADDYEGSTHVELAEEEI